MSDWLKELPPGTLLFSRRDKVIYVRVEKLPIGWTQVYVTVLDSRAQLHETNHEAGTFWDHWLKVIT